MWDGHNKDTYEHFNCQLNPQLPTCIEIHCKLSVDIASRDGVDEFLATGTVSLHTEDGRMHGDVLRDRDGVEGVAEDGCVLVHHCDGDWHHAALGDGTWGRQQIFFQHTM